MFSPDEFIGDSVCVPFLTVVIDPALVHLVPEKIIRLQAFEQEQQCHLPVLVLLLQPCTEEISDGSADGKLTNRPPPLEKIKRTFHVSWLIRIQLVKSEKLATKIFPHNEEKADSVQCRQTADGHH